MKKAYLFLFLLISSNLLSAQDKTSASFTHPSEKFTHADSLRGSNTPERAWWDVTFYDLNVNIDLQNRSISGYNAITYIVKDHPPENGKGVMQIDLMTPLQIDSIVQDHQSLSFQRDGNAFFVNLPKKQPLKSQQKITIYYHGHPREARNPPWDGGFIWQKDSLGRPWIATACQGIGASIWWPNKDYQGDEPDSQRIAITVPDPLINVSNGRLRNITKNKDNTTTFEWFVANPINNYDVAINAANYAHFKDTLAGLEGPLTLNYYVLPYHLEKAKKQFLQAKPMLHCFEYWFGPYPWYKDGYKMVESPYLGMEHQSGIGYGNGFEDGYRGSDLSHTGWGLKWDFIIIHESAHEWFGNNITTKDIADMWVHEAFANYAEALYTECLFGRKAGDEYCRGTRQNILNDRPIIGHYGVNEEGSGDMYYKGGNMLLCIREVIDNDQAFRQILRGLNKTFRHQTVTGKQVQDYINATSGIDFSKVFEQYLTTTQIPQLEYVIKNDILYFRWNGVVKGFDMPLKVFLGKDKLQFIFPTTQWQTHAIHLTKKKNFHVSENFYIQTKQVKFSRIKLE